jgi:hypothetical protein
MWFLGQAVAQADQANDIGQDNTQSSTSEGGGGVTGNVGGNSNYSSNSATIDVSTHVYGGDGGENYSNVNTGVQGAAVVVVSAGDGHSGPPAVLESVAPPRGNHDSGDATGVINIETHSVSVTQNANGGHVSNSGNISELPKLPDQTNNVRQSNTQTATSEDDGHSRGPRHHDGNQMFAGLDRNGGGHGGLTGNIGGNENESSNDLYVDISTHVRGGDGGYNDSNVNTGLQDVLFACIALHGDDAKCVADIKTGSVTVVQNANGGNVSDSGNIGRSHNQAPAKCTPPREHAKPGVSPAAKPAASSPVSQKAPAASSAQPSGQLAFTGSDVSLPLTVGLIALGLGVGLAAAGRRRETQTV